MNQYAASVLCACLAGNSLALNQQIDVSYGPSPSQKLDVWWNADNTNAPIVFMVHDGGWCAGDKRTFSNKLLAQRITDLGCVLVSVNYRLMGSEENPTALELMQDVWVALAWIREHADTYGADKNRIITGGASAGAQLSASLAYGNNRDWLTGTPYAGMEKELLSSVKGWYGDSCVVDFSIQQGGYMSEFGDLFNPIDEVEAGEPPALCINGDCDRTTPLTGVENFAKKLESVGVQCTVYIVPGGLHMTGTRMIFREFGSNLKEIPENLHTKAPYDEVRAKIFEHLDQFIREVTGK